jgi:hypothetical protein
VSFFDIRRPFGLSLLGSYRESVIHGKTPEDYAWEARDIEEARQARIRAGLNEITNNFAQFDQGFYNDRSKAFLDYQTPQLSEQYHDAYRGLMTALSRGGILRSSEGARRFGRLSTDYDRQKQQLLTKADEVSAQSRRNIENSRSALVQDLYATADPAAAQAASRARAEIEATQQSFTPIANAFSNVTSGLADYTTAYDDARLRRQFGLGQSGGNPFSDGSQTVHG